MTLMRDEAAAQGLEPRLPRPERGVLPLHQGAKCNVEDIAWPGGREPPAQTLAPHAPDGHVDRNVDSPHGKRRDDHDPRAPQPHKRLQEEAEQRGKSVTALLDVAATVLYEQRVLESAELSWEKHGGAMREEMKVWLEMLAAPLPGDEWSAVLSRARRLTCTSSLRGAASFTWRTPTRPSVTSRPGGAPISCSRVGQMNRSPLGLAIALPLTTTDWLKPVARADRPGRSDLPRLSYAMPEMVRSLSTDSLRASARTGPDTRSSKPQRGTPAS